MEMSQIYDEHLLDNRFFIQLKEQLPDLFSAAIENSWLICIPRLGTYEGRVLSDHDFMTHVLTPVSEGTNQYKTISDKHVTIKEKVVYLSEDFEDRFQVTILFDEKFYSDTLKSYQMLCIDRPLSFQASADNTAPETAQVAEFRVVNVEDAMELLFSGRNSSLKEQVDRTISHHREALCLNDATTSAIRHLIDSMHLLFTKLLQTISKSSQMKTRVRLNRHIAENLKISVEMYMYQVIYPTLFKYICTSVAADDSTLNKINRNMAQIQLKDLGVSSEFGRNVLRARKEVLSLPKYTTPFSVILGISKVLNSLTMSSTHQTSRSTEDTRVTADSLIPLLAFIIIRSNIATWNAIFMYAKEFHFSRYSNHDQQYAYNMATLEAALEYIRQFEVSPRTAVDGFKLSLPAPEHRKLIRSSSQLSRLEELFDAIRRDDMTEIECILDRVSESNSPPERKMCHPLCSCDRCESLQSPSLSGGSHPISQATVHSRDEKGLTALHHAALHNKADVTELLFDRGAVLNATDYHGATPLHLAAQKGHQAAAMMLIHKGGDVNISDNDGNKALHIATANGHEICIKAFIFQVPTVVHLRRKDTQQMGEDGPKSAPLDINAANSKGDTALHIAAKWSYETITELLLDNGAAPEARNRESQTPIMLASDVRIVNLITKAIEAQHELSDLGFTTIQMPSPDNTSDLPLVIPERITQSSTTRKVSRTVKKLLKSAADGDIEMVKHLMGWAEPTYDSDLSDDTDDNQDDLCHPLCQCRRCAPTQRKHASISDINFPDEYGRTVLQLATEKGHLDMVELLLQHHADINCRTDVLQSTPLHTACQQLVASEKKLSTKVLKKDLVLKAKLVKLLLDGEAKVNVKDVNGRTPLHFSSQMASTEITQLLIQAQANVNAQNDKGNTPLHEAAKVNNKDIVKLLLASGANPAVANKNGLTALQLAQDRKLARLITMSMEQDSFGSNDALSSLRMPDKIGAPIMEQRPAAKYTGNKSKHFMKRESMVIRSNIFTALEDDDITRLRKLLVASVHTFNRKSLRRANTVDKSAPFFDKVDNSQNQTTLSKEED